MNLDPMALALLQQQPQMFNAQQQHGYNQLQGELDDANSMEHMAHALLQQSQQNMGGGWAGVLAKGLAGYMGGKKSRDARESRKQTMKRFDKLDQRKSQQEQYLKQIEEAKQIQREKDRYERDRADRIADKQSQFENQKALQANAASLRQAPQQSFKQEMFSQLPPEQQQAAVKQMFGLGGQSQYTPDEVFAIQQNPENKALIDQKKVNKATGFKEKKELSGEIKTRLAQIENARRKLKQYADEAFVDGDYQEWGSKFGATQSYLDDAIMSKLRAESGAAIGEAEKEQQHDIFAPGMIRTDKTNRDKIQSLMDSLDITESILRSGELGDINDQFKIVPGNHKATAFIPSAKDNQLFNKY